MNELLPYENELAQKLQNLPLPDNNMAWADMKKRLEEDDDDSIIPFWLRGCMLWGLLGILLMGLGWWLLHSEKSSSKNRQSVKIDTVIVKENKEKGNQTKTNKTDTTSIINNIISINKSDSVAPEKSLQQHSIKNLLNNLKEKTNQQQIKNNNDEKLSAIKKYHQKKKKITIPGHIKIKTTNGEVDETIKENSKEKTKPNNNIESDSGSIIATNKTFVTSQQPSGIKSKIFSNKDSIKNILPDSTQKKKQIEQKPIVSKQAKDSTKRKLITFSVGIAMNQQLPFDGQQFVSYNSLGRKGTFADYIPSLYARMYKGNKWFIQGEFRYGAPQYTKDILYQQKNDTGTGTQYLNDTSIHLKKTYYQQLPITFNYFITPKLSLGTGIIWNKFNSAVSEQNITRHDNFTGTDSVISKGVVINQKKADSNFVSSYLQAVFEAQYKWKKFSFGARYSFGLQPYLKFNLPGSSEHQEKNQSIILFIRYELWRSKKK